MIFWIDHAANEMLTDSITFGLSEVFVYTLLRDAEKVKEVK